MGQSNTRAARRYCFIDEARWDGRFDDDMITAEVNGVTVNGVKFVRPSFPRSARERTASRRSCVADEMPRKDIVLKPKQMLACTSRKPETSRPRRRSVAK